MRSATVRLAAAKTKGQEAQVYDRTDGADTEKVSGPPAATAGVPSFGFAQDK